ncbi:hypothetical protein D3C85_706910 [compost metagenome]
MTVLAIAVVPARGEGHESVFRLAAQHFGAFHLKAQPRTLRAPVADRLTVQAGLLGGQGGGHQIVDQPQHIGAVA